MVHVIRFLWYLNYGFWIYTYVSYEGPRGCDACNFILTGPQRGVAYAFFFLTGYRQEGRVLAREQTNYCKKRKSGAARSRQLAPVFGGKVHIESSAYRKQILCMYTKKKIKKNGAVRRRQLPPVFGANIFGAKSRIY